MNSFWKQALKWISLVLELYALFGLFNSTYLSKFPRDLEWLGAIGLFSAIALVFAALSGVMFLKLHNAGERSWNNFLTQPPMIIWFVVNLFTIPLALHAFYTYDTHK